MNATRPAAMPAGRDFGLLSLGRWVLILLLAFDLIGSPFHAHAHDFGGDGLGSHAVHAGESADAAGAVHAEEFDGPGFGHSIVALRPAEPARGAWAVAVATTICVRPSGGGLAETMPPCAGWRSALTRVPISPFPHLRPDSRAPPVRHS